MLTRGEPRNVGCHVHKLGARLHLRVSALRSSATAAAPLHDRNNQTLITPSPEPQSETPLPRSLLSFKVPTTLIFRALSKVRSLELTCAKHTLVKVRKSKRLTRAHDDGLTQPHRGSSLTFARVPVWALCAMSSRQASPLGRARTCLTCQIMTLLAHRMSIDRRPQKW
jgi:hypothetical protein